jgi:type IV secretion system protein VirB10
MSGNNAPPGRDIHEAGSVVSGPGRPGLTARQKFGLAGLLLVVFLGLILLEKLHQGASSPLQRAPVTTTSGVPFQEAPVASAAPSLPLPTTNTFTIAPMNQRETAAESPIMAFSGAVPAPLPANAASLSLGSGVAGQALRLPVPAAETALSDRLQETPTAPVRAAMLAHPDFLITEGTIIPCTLQTAINSELAGYVTCVTPQDIMGTTGDVVLLDKGTRVFGEIQSGLLQGQDRLFVLWDRAETPQHAIISLDAPGSDEVGRAGLPGAVNSHFWERFGSAILLSVIQGALQAGTAYAGNAGSSNGAGSAVLNNFQGNGSQLADSALSAAINIPPTLEKNQGDNVSIFVNRDLDFSTIYSLQVSGDGQSGGD